MPSQPGPPHRLFAALALISAALLGFELLLPRVIAVQHWHQLTEVVIAVALLGLASAAVLASACSELLLRHRYWLLPAAALTTACMMALSLWLSQQLPLNMLALPWYWQQAIYLALYGLSFVLPFFTGGLFISLVFMRWSVAIGACYAADLCGSAAGVVLVLFWMDSDWTPGGSLESALLLCMALALLAGLVSLPPTPRWRLAGVAIASAICWWQWQLPPHIAPSEFKALVVTLGERGARVLEQRDSSQSRLTRSTSTGQHLAPGLSLASELEAPAQQLLFMDGDATTVLLMNGSDAGHRALFGQSISAAAYLAAPPRPRVLLLPGNHSWNSWAAHWHDASSITLVEPDRRLATWWRGRDWVDAQFVPPSAVVHTTQARRLLASPAVSYNLIIAELDSAEAGSPATRAQWLLTREALTDMLDRLTADGVLAFNLQLQPLPRDSLRLLNSLVEVLEARQLSPQQHLLLVRDWRNAVVLVSRSGFSVDRLARLQRWGERWQFDLLASPDLIADEAQPFHRREGGRLLASFRQLLSAQRAELVAHYPFALSLTDDDRPFFQHYFRWQHWREIRDAVGKPWLLYVGWSYLLNLSALVLLSLTAATLLIAPLSAPTLRARLQPGRLALLGYFGSIGLGFMLLEIALLQHIELLTDSPTAAFALVLVALLSGAGIGSFCAGKFAFGPRLLCLASGCIAAAALAYPELLDRLLVLTLQWSSAGRSLLLGLLLAVLALPMGVMFPRGIAAIRHRGSAAIAWSWAVNGFCSVCGALGAPLLATVIGWSGLGVCAAGFYLLAALCYRGLGGSSEPEGRN